MTWVEPDEWYARLASFHAAAAVFVTDEADRVLLVKPTYRSHWSLPGGYVDQQESPHAALARELREELDLQVPIGDLLVIDWAPAAPPRPRPLVNFLFDGGRLCLDRPLLLDHDEVEDAAFHDLSAARTLLPARVAPRLDAAVHARTSGAAVYLVGALAPTGA